MAKFKKTLSIIASTLLLLLSQYAKAEIVHTDTRETSGYEFIDHNNTLIISGTGVLKTEILRKYARFHTVDTVIIKEGITEINDRAFMGCTTLNTIQLPKSLTAIHNEAFQDCINLSCITIPDNTYSIGNSAFYGCRNLEEVEINSKVLQFVGTAAFFRCKNLKKVIYHGTQEPIGSDAFKLSTSYIGGLYEPFVKSLTNDDYCINLEYIIVPNEYKGSKFCGMPIRRENLNKHINNNIQSTCTLSPCTPICALALTSAIALSATFLVA